jgi:hypothetical protein
MNWSTLASWAGPVVAITFGLWFFWRHQSSLSRSAMESSRQDAATVVWGPCCFCAQPITPTTTDPCRVIVQTQEGKDQVWFCHSACFKERLQDPPEAPGLFEPAHF